MSEGTVLSFMEAGPDAMNFLRRLFHIEPKLVIRNHTHLVTGASVGLSLDQWQKDDELVKLAKEVHANVAFRAMLDVLRTESPSGWVLKGVSDSDRLVQLGRIEGYQMALNNIDALAKRTPVKAPLEATFEPEEQPPEPEPES